MINVSSNYKEIMSRPIRNRAYVSVGIGVVNQTAQSNANASGDFAYWSCGNIFNQYQSMVDYATLEENQFRVDGSMLFMPENKGTYGLKYSGKITNDILGTIRIKFNDSYSIKGITIDFGSVYPTKFTITTEEKALEYENQSDTFSTNDVLGTTSYILIKPTSMVGGQQRFRIKSILMGVGISFSNMQTKQIRIAESNSPISEDLPTEDVTYSFYDEEDNFDVDDDNSFIDFLETMQKVTVSFGLELDDGSVEWNQVSTTYLKDWKSQKGVVTLSMTDRLQQMEDKYTLGNKIYERTAYKEAERILQDAGLDVDDYIIDDYLADITLKNPMPVASHKECLQLLANACRCIIRQDENGKIIIKANFAIVINPDDLEVTTNGTASWSIPENVVYGGSAVYAELTADFFKLDGAMYFLPENTTYLNTSYVSESISDISGKFEINPTLTISMPASYSYYGVNVVFDGNPPEELIIHTYKNDVSVEDVTFKNLTSTSYLMHEFKGFDKMTFEFTKAKPENRVLVSKISFGTLSDYVLTKQNMLEQPIGYKEKKTKSVRVKVYSYQNDEEGNPKEVEDDVYVEKTINTVGEIKTVQNQLISSTEQAETLAEWIANHYANNVSYDVEYRGEPRIDATDIIYMESDKKKNLQVEITKNTLTFDGAFSGELELRRALKLTR